MTENTQSSKSVDVFGVGNALVDILALVKDDFISQHQLNRGVMTLVDAQQQGLLLQDLKDIELQLRCGGSAANTAIALAQSGGTGFYTGKVADDFNGKFYRQDMLDSGIGFEVPPASSSSGPTGTCLVLTTPDADRTMCTNLGVSVTLAATDINVDRLSRCKYSYVEGYLWDGADTTKACMETMEQSKRLGVPVSFTFSDPFVVDRFADDFRKLLPEYCDLLFCNADEVRRFCEMESLDDCASKLGEMVKTAFITDGPNGCLVVENKQVTRVPGFPVKAIDTVGAGDAFAGGTLFGITHGYSATQAGRWGNYLGSECVKIQGPRLEVSYVDKVAEVIAS